MKLLLTLSLALLLSSLPVFALSRPIDRDLEFPKGFDPVRAEAIRTIVRDEQFKFLGGIVSYWEPDYGTRLSYTGDAASLNAFFTALRKLPGMSLKVILYRGRDDEGRRDSAWQLDFLPLRCFKWVRGKEAGAGDGRLSGAP